MGVTKKTHQKKYHCQTWVHVCGYSDNPMPHAMRQQTIVQPISV